MSQLPGDTSLPLFVYGALKPGEISWPLLQRYVVDHQTGELTNHKLVVLDGVPTIEPEHGKNLKGQIVHLKNHIEAYAALAEFEQVPKNYVWREVELHETKTTTRCNVLVLANESRSRKDEVSDWSACDDAYLGFATPWSYSKLKSLAGTFGTSRPPDESLYLDYLELQSVFMLLWALTERIILFRVPESQNHNLEYNVHRLAHIEEWSNAAGKARIDTHVGVRSNLDPFAAEPTRTGKSGFTGWYKVRTNVVHRGKGAFKEASMLARVTLDMHNTLAILLQEISPSVRDLWLDLTKTKKEEHTGRLYVI